MSLDGFLGDISDDEVRHRKSSSHRGLPSRRKPDKVTNFWCAKLDLCMQLDSVYTEI